MFVNYFHFASECDENHYIKGIKRTCHNTYYPFNVFVKRDLARLDFSPITLLSGGNGTGKTTALNIMAQKLNAKRYAVYNHSAFFDDYLALCYAQPASESPDQIEMIASDDVFDFLLSLREINQSIDDQRDAVTEDYLSTKYADFKMRSLDDFDALKKVNRARSLTQSKYIRSQLMDNVIGKSNGESAYYYFLERIKPGGLYFLDEPENSLSPNYQMQLVDYIISAARFDRCQFIIATHSPFILAIDNSTLYDFNAVPVCQKSWHQLAQMRQYYQFFKAKGDYFE